MRNILLKMLFATLVIGRNMAFTSASQVIYVDTNADGLNNGSSWINAYTNLQDALTDANDSDKPIEIRVAQGIYKPDQGTGIVHGDREATFQLINGVTIKGGYAGTSLLDANARDIESYSTILSGDLADNDIPMEDVEPSELYKDPTFGENSLYVVAASRIDPNTVLDGFIIKAATTAGLNLYYLADINISNCTFVNNAASGIICHASEPYIVDCVFMQNVKNVNGGGIFIESNSYPKILRCIFENNWADNGGGLYSRSSRFHLEDCTFKRNVASGLWHIDVGWGGGVCNHYDTEGSKIINCTFTDNVASVGGAYYGDTGELPSISQEEKILFSGCDFVNNQALSGGAMHQRLSFLGINNCTFHENSAIYGQGGAISNPFSITNITNSIFSGNSASQTASSIFTAGSEVWLPGRTAGPHLVGFNLYLNNCTFSGNFSPKGRTITCISDETEDLDSTVITNCILDNGGEEIYNPEGSNVTINYTNLRGGTNSVHDPHNAIIWGEGNIDVDPLFADPGYWADANDPSVIVEPNKPNAVWIVGDYHLKSETGRWNPVSESWVIDNVTSSCIDVGDLNDPVGDEPEPNGGRINMGAYGGTAEASKSPVN